jgi:hypothetical protein
MGSDVENAGGTPSPDRSSKAVGVGGSVGDGGHENETGRIEAFSDGVIAIAITLLIIEVGVPHVDEQHPALLDAVAGQWPVYLA